jgi:thiosulfate/3-mercaptopyruvate sulfurtransferase
LSAARLVNPPELLEWIQAGRCVVFDCRFDLHHPGAGRNSWLAGHIPGAVYAHLDEDLSGSVTETSGRHPLPSPDAFAEFLGRSGWEPGRLAVAYDGGGGAVAARLWWLMKYFGLEGAALLDGGMTAWMALALPMEAGETRPVPTKAVKLVADTGCVVDADEVAHGMESGVFCLLDARPAARFRGEVEPLDAVAGHIPGARCHPFELNLADGRLRPAAELRKALRPYAGKDGSGKVVHMCGSGVTACLNLFAMEHAGLGDNRLYVGSWSEWIRDRERPLALGDD